MRMDIIKDKLIELSELLDPTARRNEYAAFKLIREILELISERLGEE